MKRIRWAVQIQTQAQVQVRANKKRSKQPFSRTLKQLKGDFSTNEIHPLN